MLEPIKVKAIQMAIRTLTNLGCKLKVISPDGTEYGELEVMPPKAPRVKINSFISTGYVEKVHALCVGETLTMPAPNPEVIDAFRATLVACCIKKFGKGSVISEIDAKKGEVTILRQV